MVIKYKKKKIYTSRRICPKKKLCFISDENRTPQKFTEINRIRLIFQLKKVPQVEIQIYRYNKTIFYISK